MFLPLIFLFLKIASCYSIAYDFDKIEKCDPESFVEEDLGAYGSNNIFSMSIVMFKKTRELYYLKRFHSTSKDLFLEREVRALDLLHFSKFFPRLRCISGKESKDAYLIYDVVVGITLMDFYKMDSSLEFDPGRFLDIFTKGLYALEDLRKVGLIYTNLDANQIFIDKDNRIIQFVGLFNTWMEGDNDVFASEIQQRLNTMGSSCFSSIYVTFATAFRTIAEKSFTMPVNILRILQPWSQGSHELNLGYTRKSVMAFINTDEIFKYIDTSASKENKPYADKLSDTQKRYLTFLLSQRLTNSDWVNIYQEDYRLTHQLTPEMIMAKTLEAYEPSEPKKKTLRVQNKPKFKAERKNRIQINKNQN
ncbi:hypothetical protein ROZALSC1DRAFT_29862 [Rozella allomycis CSF55]|uniref:Protein kinase domain-containing protein n=1 Tax=Rozella allomycis (strain CSF55) TaxID=988480 RepID=A0A075AY60_ROZAC|nr:hypothetical protein O9G_000397 [Rozella allomycis CSF55]RKP18464.1 hypothetical protein ROZALSC1DRAFT_29862 [Rozella allomycis CSF55]|eukprot:EPZ33622.1 hypothetical protein O9G_000397 [Rozella allomycis CSF55]